MIVRMRYGVHGVTGWLGAWLRCGEHLSIEEHADKDFKPPDRDIVEFMDMHDLPRS